MAVTVVFGNSTDGYLHSYDATYSNSRNGPADGVNGGTAGWVGQAGPATYRSFQTFLGFTFPVVPDTEIVTSAAFRTHVITQRNPTIGQYLEHWSYSWGTLTTADWRTPAQIYDGELEGTVFLTANANDKYAWGARDELLDKVRAATSVESVMITSRQRAGNTPSTDEALAITTADASGTTDDPALVYTSAPRSTLFGVLGAQVRVSTGWAYIESSADVGVPLLQLKHRAFDGTVTTIDANVPQSTIGASNCFYPPQGAQHLALVADSTGNLFILGRWAAAKNALAIRAYAKGSGATWTARDLRAVGSPAHNARMNNVAAAWHSTAGGTIVAVVSHNASTGHPTIYTDFSYVLLSSAAFVNVTSGQLRGSGYGVPTLQPAIPSVYHHNTYTNETGTGLDVVSSGDVGHVYSFAKSAALGDNQVLHHGRYRLNSTGTGFASTSTDAADLWGLKDAGGKVRAVPISSSAVAFLATDEDAGFGLSLAVKNMTDSSSTEFGYAFFADDPVTGMPDGPDIASSAAWDATYNSAGNDLWVYYVEDVSPPVLRRTRFDLDSMQRSNNTVIVHTFTAGDEVQAIRVARNSGEADQALVTCAILNGTTRSSVYVQDAFNVEPNAPTLTPEANFDATTDATFEWTVNDPSGDAQSAYQLEITNAATSVVALDTGKVVSAISSRTVAGGTLANGNSYQWRVRTYDGEDAESPWSDYGTFTTAAGGNVTITDPATDNPLDLITDDLPITWSVTGSTQAAYRVWLYRGVDLVSDTGWIASTETTHTVSGMLSDQQHEVWVQTRNGSNVTTNIAVRQLKPSYSTPELPLIAAQSATGYVSISIVNPAPGAPELGYPEEGFEAGIGTWVPGPNASFTHETTTVHQGVGAARLESTLTGQDPVYARDYTNPVAVTPGTRYTARMWVYHPTGGSVSPTIDWMQGDGTYISSSSYGQPIPAATWTNMQVTGTCPATAALAVYGLTIGGGVDAGTYAIIDEVVLTGASDRPDVAHNEILRRPVRESGEWEVVGVTDPDGTFRDYTAAPGVAYHYIARGQAS